jgi:hypothetical protein
VFLCHPTFTFVELINLISFQAEQNSVAELQSLLTRSIEALSFVLLLSDYNLGGLVAKLVYLSLFTDSSR